MPCVRRPRETGRSDEQRSDKQAQEIAEIPAGSWTKWVVVGFWAILLVILYPLSAKLHGVEKNDAKQWLPANAESTKVAFGILLDTIVVRSVLVTALNLDLGHRMWWPSRLARKPDPAPAELSHERATALTSA